MQTLKPCPFCGPGESVVECYADDYGYWKVGCGRCGSHSGTRPQSDPDAQAKVISHWNTRPDAPVDGLETYMRADFGTVDLVTRSQAEAIIAAERAEATALREALIDEQSKRRILEADNAALTARVKELEAENAALEKQALRDRSLANETHSDATLWQFSVDMGDHPSLLVKVWRQRKALETQLAAARKALEPFALISSEGVISTKSGHVTVTTCAEYFHEARAALEDRP